MSRSYKKHPALSGVNENGTKRMANRKVRRTLKNSDITLNGNDYKKIFCSWMIHDFTEVAPSKKAFIDREKERYYLYPWHWTKKLGHAPTDEEIMEFYNRWYVRK